MTVKDILRHIQDDGFTEVEGRSRKYRKFTKDAPTRIGVFLFVGRKGAVRKGRSISNSISLTAHFRGIV